VPGAQFVLQLQLQIQGVAPKTYGVLCHTCRTLSQVGYLSTLRAQGGCEDTTFQFDSISGVQLYDTIHVVGV
jgi:hypothetical protein